jgi:hypothetical protein
VTAQLGDFQGQILALEDFQQKCAAVLRPEMRYNKEGQGESGMAQALAGVCAIGGCFRQIIKEWNG